MPAPPTPPASDALPELRTRPVRREWTALAALTVLAWAFRSIYLGGESVGADEIRTFKAVAAADGATVWNSVTPLYYVLAKIWLSAWAKPGVMQLRAFSVFAAGFAPAALWIAARAWGLPRPAAWICAGWMLLSPFAYWHAQEALVFGTLATAATAWLATVPATFDTARKHRVAWHSGLLALAVFSLHYYFVFLVLGTASGLLLWWLCFDRRSEVIIRLAMNGAWTLLCMAALAPLLWSQRHNLAPAGLAPPQWPDFIQAVREMWWVGPWCWPGFWVWPFSLRIRLIFLCLATSGLGWAWFALKACYGEVRPGPARIAKLALVFAGASIGGLLAAFMFSRWKFPVFAPDRFSLVFLGPFMLLVGTGWALWPRKAAPWAAPFMLALLAAASLPTILDYWRAPQNFDWQGGVRVIDAEWREGDRLMFCPNWETENYQYNRGKAHGDPLDATKPESFGSAGRVWLFAWDGAAPETGLPAVKAFRDARPHQTKLTDGLGHSLTLIEAGK